MGLLDKVKDSINFMKDLPDKYKEIYDTYVKGEIYGSSRGGISIDKALKQAEEAGATDEELKQMKEDYQKEINKIKGTETKARGGMMNKPRKMSNGGMANKGTKVRGQGAAIRGTKFKGVF